ncbi:MAG: DUF1549 domain-containing protein, partial [Candidatus Solibacter sp.]
MGTRSAGLRALTLAAACITLLSAATVDFQRDVRPVLSDNCFQCHGPDEKSRMAGLRLDRRDTALEARPRGAAIVPGKSAASLLVQRISETNAARRMPPESAHKHLTPAQIDLLRQWIDQGASWKEHWAFQAPVKAAPPAVRNVAWPRNAIDRFVLARLEAEGLAPAPAADARTLIRRVALDVTGLPPKPAEIDTYLKDLAPGAYERMVDRYLASPHYGEHRGRYWLDAARYGDTHGIHIDNYRDIWPYRDWVIAAFNRNLPFDRFTLEQLAGDLLPNPTLDQRIATGFQRCAVTTNEAGIIEDEYAEIYAKDRADTTGAVWLGLTVGCATCHDHKFDPILQKDFYALGAFFRNTTQKVMDGNISDTPPIILVPRAEDRARWQAIQSRLTAVAAEMDAVRKLTWAPSSVPTSEPIETAFIADLPAVASLLPFIRPGGREFENPPKQEAEKPFSVSASFLLPAKDQSYVVASQQNSRDRNRGWSIEIAGRVAAFRIVGNNGEAIEVRSANPEIKLGEWNHVTGTYDGSRNQSGLALYVNGRNVSVQGLGARAAKLSGNINVDDPIVAGRSLAGGYISDLRVFRRVLTEAEARLMSEWPAIRGGDRAALVTYQLQTASEPYRRLAAEQHKLNLEAREIARRGAVTQVMEERNGEAPFAFTLY